MARGNSPVSRRAKVALASMVFAATALIAFVIVSSSPASLIAQGGASYIAADLCESTRQPSR